MSTTRRSAGVWSRKRPLGPNGEKICYNCGGPLPKGRRFNCSSECSEEWRTKTSPGYMRVRVWERDRGVCALCGLDTAALRLSFEKSRAAFKASGDYYKTKADWLKANGIPAGRESTDWWDADHIVPVIEGGGECGLENYRTLCIPCHNAVTRQLHSRAKAKRKEERIQKVPLPLFDQEEHV